MRRFEVWAGCDHGNAHTVTIEMPDDASDEDCEEACRDACETMIGNHFDTGWRETTKEVPHA